MVCGDGWVWGQRPRGVGAEHSEHRGLREFGGWPKSIPEIELALRIVGGVVGSEGLLPASRLKSKAGQSPGHVSRCSGQSPAPKPTCVLEVLTRDAPAATPPASGLGGKAAAPLGDGGKKKEKIEKKKKKENQNAFAAQPSPNTACRRMSWGSGMCPQPSPGRRLLSF